MRRREKEVQRISFAVFSSVDSSIGVDSAELVWRSLRSNRDKLVQRPANHLVIQPLPTPPVKKEEERYGLVVNELTFAVVVIAARRRPR